VSRRILLVTGSRALTGHARMGRILLAEVSDLKRYLGYVVAGDAGGPDELAHSLAKACGVHSVTYRLDGTWQSTDANTPGGRWDAKLSQDELREIEDPRRRPLVRNNVMAHSVGMQGDRGWQVHCLALIAPWSKTKGTEHTARRAEQYGIPVTRVLFVEERQ